MHTANQYSDYIKVQKMMTKRELVKSAIKHENSGKVPSCIHLAGDGIDKYTDLLYDRYLTTTAKKLYESGKLGKYDAVRLAIGNDVFPVSPPWWDWYGLTERDFQFDVPDRLPTTMGSGPSVREMSEHMKMIKEETGCYILVMIFGSHFEKAYFSRGIENFLADMAGEPEYAQALLNKIIAKNMVMIENIINLPEIDGVLLGSDWGSQRSLLMSPESWREMIAPGEKKEYDLIHEAGKDVWVHSCGCIDVIIPDLVEMGLDVLNPVQPECMDIGFLKRQYGNKLSFWGGISTQKTLPYGSPEQVAEETHQTIELMSENGGYITSSSQEIQADVPFENLCALIDAANEHK